MKTEVVHSVEPNANGYFEVVSGKSGTLYRVTPIHGEQASCTCKWFRETGQRCSHITAVVDWSRNILRAQTYSL